MEADWSVELAAGDPVVVVPWNALDESFRFVDLRENIHAIDEIEEAQQEPALHSALLVLNGAGSQLWTAKCDTWTSGSHDEHGELDPIDPWEMDAAPEDAVFTAGCYIDVLLRDGASFAVQERWIRALTERLRGVELRCARIELVLRRAEVRGRSGFAVTCFFQGCGATSELAAFRWAEALAHALPALLQVVPVPLRSPGE